MSKITLSRPEIIAGVRAHAQKNYSKAGWDILAETWTDADIDACMGIRTGSVLGAVQMISIFGGLKLLDEQRQAAKAEATVEAAPTGWTVIEGGAEVEPTAVEAATAEEVAAPAVVKKARKAKKAA